MRSISSSRTQNRFRASGSRGGSISPITGSSTIRTRCCPGSPTRASPLSEETKMIKDSEPNSERALSETNVRPWPAGQRDLAMETMYEYGSRVGYWRLLQMFDEFGVKCTFYACGVALERNLKAAAEMRGRGHDVISHGWRWEDVALLTREEEREHIRLAVKSIEATTGQRPLGWY